MAANKEKRRRRAQGKAASAARRKEREARVAKGLPAKEPRPYIVRWRLLQELGYKDYAEYLKGALWKQIKTEVMQGATECRGCDRPPVVVHHMSYGRETLLGTDRSGLVPVCNSCHYRIEFKNGVKRSFNDARNCAITVFRKKVKRNDRSN